MVGHIFAFLLARACTDTLVLFYGAMMKPLFVHLRENGQGKSQMRITQRQGDVNRHIMIADGPRTLSPFPSQPYLPKLHYTRKHN